MKRIYLPTCSLLWTLALCLCGTSAAAEEPAPDNAASAAAPSITQDPYQLQRHQAGALAMDEQLGLQLPDDTIVLTLEAGQQRFHALRQEPDQPEPTGALLLLPDPETGPAWPSQAAALRMDLAAHGWSTLALEPPAPDSRQLPPRTLPVLTPLSHSASLATGTAAGSDTPSAAETASDITGNAPTTSTEPPAPFAERFNQRLDLALEELRRSSPDVQILVAFGRSAPWAAAWLSTHPQPEMALILIDPLPDRQPGAPQLADLWEALSETRVIDLYHQPLPGYPQAAEDARIRLSQARRAESGGYYQSRIAAPFRGWRDQMPWLTRRVRGLIRTQILEPLAAERALSDNRQKAATSQNPPGIPALE